MTPIFKTLVMLCGLGLCSGCFSEVPGVGGAGSASDATGTTSEDCPDGSLGCACNPDGSCDDAGQCEPELQLCIPECVGVGPGCPCPPEGCGSGLECDAGLCVVEGDGGTTTTSTTTSMTVADATTAADTSGATTAGSATGSESTDTGGPNAAELVLYFTGQEEAFTPWSSPQEPRALAETLCATASLTVERPCTQVAALVSISADDQIADFETLEEMPFGATVVNRTGGPVAPSFSEMLSDGLGVSLFDSEVFNSEGFAPSVVLTGSEADGTSALGGNCAAWTDVNGTMQVGRSTEVGSNWISFGTEDCGFVVYPLLCACWDPT